MGLLEAAPGEELNHSLPIIGAQVCAPPPALHVRLRRPGAHVQEAAAHGEHPAAGLTTAAAGLAGRARDFSASCKGAIRAAVDPGMGCARVGLTTLPVFHIRHSLVLHPKLFQSSLGLVPSAIRSTPHRGRMGDPEHGGGALSTLKKLDSKWDGVNRYLSQSLVSGACTPGRASCRLDRALESPRSEQAYGLLGPTGLTTLHTGGRPTPAACTPVGSSTAWVASPPRGRGSRFDVGVRVGFHTLRKTPCCKHALPAGARGRGPAPLDSCRRWGDHLQARAQAAAAHACTSHAHASKREITPSTLRTCPARRHAAAAAGARAGTCVHALESPPALPPQLLATHACCSVPFRGLWLCSECGPAHAVGITTCHGQAASPDQQSPNAPQQSLFGCELTPHPPLTRRCCPSPTYHHRSGATSR